jgi:hypothetical protein
MRDSFKRKWMKGMIELKKGDREMKSKLRKRNDNEEERKREN